MPDLHESLIKRLAGGDIYNPDIKDERYTLLILANVLTKVLVVDVVRALSDLRSGHAGALQAAFSIHLVCIYA